jgi:hypothetical protein
MKLHLGIVCLLAGLTLGCTQRNEIETGPRTLRSQEQMERERFETRKEIERERLAAMAAMQKERIEAQKERDAARRRQCWFDGRKYCP